MIRKKTSILLSMMLIAVFLAGCSWTSGFTIVLPDREIEVSIPETGVEIPKVDVDLFGRDRVRGSGDVVTVSREVKDFDQISILGMGEISIVQGDEESLTVTIEDNLLVYLWTEVKAGTLTLGWDPDKANHKDIKPSRPIEYEIVVKDLSRLSIYGSANIDAGNFSSSRLTLEIFGTGDISMERVVSDRISIRLLGVGNIEVNSLFAETLKVDIPGHGDVKLAGEVEEQEVNIPGSGDYQAKDLRSEIAYVSIYGSGDAELWVTEYLEGESFGSGHLMYYGNPSTQFSGVGSGNFEYLGER